MQHNKDFKISTATLAVILGIGAVMFPSITTAAVTVNETYKVSMFGDVRFRAERDDRSGTGGTDRSRLRLRARFGVGFAPNKEWSGKIRLATNSDSLNSPYKTFGTKQDGNSDFGLDQAYLAYTGVSQLTLVAGKTALNFWQQNELFWDQDINPDAVTAVCSLKDITLNAAYAVVADGNWSGDTTVWIYQAVNKGKVSGMDYTVALGGASLSFPTPLTYQAQDHLQLSAQLKSGSWLAGLDYLKSDASTEDTAYVIQGRYKVHPDWGLRLYYYHVEAFAPLGDGTFSQDNWPNPGSTGVSNFEGIRFQVDYKVDTNTSLDLRYYDAKRIKATAGLPAPLSDAVMSRSSHNRLQANLTVKF